MSNFLYFLKEALINFKRNMSTSLGAIVTIFLSLFVIGLFVIGSMLVNNVLGNYENEVTIRVMISDSASQNDIDTLGNYIQGLDNVDSVTWISKEQALQDFSDQSSMNPEIIDQLDGTNPLPASYEVKLVDSQQVETVAGEIGSNETFLKICDKPDNPSDSLKYGQGTVKKLFQVINVARGAAIGIVALLIFVTFIFINNTIRLAILARRKEIAIMRLVGASNGFIRGPFLMEGTLQSIVGAGLAIISLQIIRNTALAKVQASINWLNISIAGSAYTKIYLLLLAFGLVIGIFASLLAMRRYLKV